MSLNKIETVKKLSKKGMYELTINNVSYNVTEDLIVKYTLIKGKELSENELDLIKIEIANENLILKVYNYISYQFRSEYEVIKYLEELNATDIQINDIIIKLKSLNMIDDDNLSKLLLNNCITQLKGPKAYKNKLYERKIDIIYEYSEEEQIETIKKAIEKNIDKNIELPALKQKSLLMHKLLRDGFDEEYVYRLINQIEFVETDEQIERLKQEINKLQIKYSKYSDYEKKNKIINSLMLKGYSYNQINLYLNNY